MRRPPRIPDYAPRIRVSGCMANQRSVHVFHEAQYGVAAVDCVCGAVHAGRLWRQQPFQPGRGRSATPGPTRADPAHPAGPAAAGRSGAHSRLSRTHARTRLYLDLVHDQFQPAQLAGLEPQRHGQRRRRRLRPERDLPYARLADGLPQRRAAGAAGFDRARQRLQL